MRTKRYKPHGRRGFTLLEMLLAMTLLAVFLLPLMLIISRSKVRAIKFSQQRELRDLAQRKLFDRIHYYIEEEAGDFSEDGRPEWTWEVPQAEMIGRGDQPLLEYVIVVHTPQIIEGLQEGELEGSVFELRLWAFPDATWYEEQQELMDRGLYSPLFGDPTMDPLGALGGLGGGF